PSLKQCAFCYRGDEHLLGQGRLVVFGPTPGYIPLHILSRRASSDRDNDCHDHCYRGDQSSSEFVEQLGPIGLPHDINVQSLFDPTGQCCAHLQCAAWSEGVCRGEGQSLLYVDKAIDSGCTQVCVFCRRLGASLRCQETGCGRSYHFPCAAAAGAHQDWNQRRTWCTRHAHTVSSQCALCLSDGDVSDLLMCCCCGDCYHGSCLNPPLTPSPLCRAGWQCPNCRKCQSCSLRGDDGALLVCERCDKSYHTHCLTPPLDHTSTTGWSCKNCRVCRRCGVRSSGHWANHPFLCESCDPALPCPLCDHPTNLYTPQEYLTCTCFHLVPSEQPQSPSNAIYLPPEQSYTPSHPDPTDLQQSPASPDPDTTKVQHSSAPPHSDHAKSQHSTAPTQPGPTDIQQIPAPSPPESSELQQSPAPSHPNSLELPQSSAPSPPNSSEQGLTESQPDPSELQKSPAPSDPDSSELKQSFASSHPDPSELQKSPAPSHPDPSELQKSHAPCHPDPSELQKSPPHAPLTTVLPLTPKIGMGKPAISKRKFSPGRARVKQGRGSGFPGRRRSRGGGVGGGRGGGGRGRSRLKTQDSLTVSPGPFQPKEEEENSMHNTVVMFSTSDHYTLRQDMCVVCGSFGQGAEGRLLACSQCGQCYHPYCVNVKMTRVVLTKGWRCLECTVCEACGEASDPGRLLLCDDCDISYHTYCLDPPLHTVPKGAWKCKWCVWCVQCGSTSPGLHCDWQSNYSLCGLCASLSRCPVCQRQYTQDDLILQCQQCDRWVHAICQGLNTEDEVELAADEGFDCSLNCYACVSGRSDSFDSPYMAQIISRIREPDTKTYTQDGVCLTESGLSHLQSLVEPLTSPRRYRRCKPKLKLRIINQNSVSVLQTPPDPDPPTEQDHSRGECDLECEMKSDSSPERVHAPDDDVTKESDVTDGNKKRKRKPYRPGIGGFMVRQRGAKAGPGRIKLCRKDLTDVLLGRDEGETSLNGASELTPTFFISSS
uniref:[Histone H3]-lysine(4) N-trimethyltransferase n=1 Tax=Anabas testudineus TaxID=64144 RepID=A0AAQ6ITY2_ANATE